MGDANSIGSVNMGSVFMIGRLLLESVVNILHGANCRGRISARDRQDY